MARLAISHLGGGWLAGRSSRLTLGVLFSLVKQHAAPDRLQLTPGFGLHRFTRLRAVGRMPIHTVLMVLSNADARPLCKGAWAMQVRHVACLADSASTVALRASSSFMMVCLALRLVDSAFSGLSRAASFCTPATFSPTDLQRSGHTPSWFQICCLPCLLTQRIFT